MTFTMPQQQKIPAVACLLLGIAVLTPIATRLATHGSEPVYNSARDYNPTIGRYLEADPIGMAGGQNNLYTYVDGNPVTRVDPKGLASCTYSITSHTMVCTPNAGGPSMTLGPQSLSSGDGPLFANNPSTSWLPELGPIVPGQYNMNPDLRPGHDGFWRLEPNPKVPGWQCDAFLQRCGFELHPGTVSLGCITADKNDKSVMQQYNDINNLLWSDFINDKIDNDFNTSPSNRLTVVK